MIVLFSNQYEESQQDNPQLLAYGLKVIVQISD